MQDTTIISSNDVLKILGIHRMTLYRLIQKDKTFPKPFKIGRLNKWKKYKIDNWVDSKAGT
jgi:predicted DNA-binding transcriptional regulator AlpA